MGGEVFGQLDCMHAQSIRHIIIHKVCVVHTHAVLFGMLYCILCITVYALIFRHSNYSSWASKGMKSILIDDEIACVLILRQRP